ncbi:hypothetical protein [Kutzneria kofuensis]|uniref:hypothetical protein n=1 Tax=Kutzneria kofuensis TaxID=103725 RepID=UPI0031F0CEDF
MALPVTADHGPVFHVDVDATADRFGVRLADGTPVSVDGPTFAKLVAKSSPFRSLTKHTELAAVALPGSRAGALTHADGAAHSFQRGLAELGRDVPVVAADGRTVGGCSVTRTRCLYGRAGLVHVFGAGEAAVSR